MREEKHKVLVAMPLTASQVKRLRAVSPQLNIVEMNATGQQSLSDPAQLFDGDEEVLLCLRVPQDLALAPKLRWVQLQVAGIERLIGHPIMNTDISITTASGVHAVPIGEFSIGIMLALARKVPLAVRTQDREVWPEETRGMFKGIELRGKTLGIIGYGSIGREAARIAKQGFQMRVHAIKRSENKADQGYVEPGVGDPEGRLPDAWFRRDQLKELLAQSDFVLISSPLTSETRNMIGETELCSLKPTAFIVNIARGEIIDEAALVRALKEKWIAGAGLDVFAKEPLSPESELWKLDNVLITPHISSWTDYYNDRLIALFAENLRRYLRDEKLLNLVDRERGY